MIEVGIVGATGYTGVELLRLLALHPEVDIAVVTSRTEAGKRVDELFSNLRGHVDLAFTMPDLKALASCDVVFFATPNGTAMQMAGEVLQGGAKVIDLSADFRIEDPAVWEHWYHAPHAIPELLQEAVYGLPEINRDTIRQARLVANPGCYPTAILLGFLPLVEQGLVDPLQLIADAKSGVSGAGRKAQITTLLCEASESLKAYGVSGHRHLPEITQGLEQLSGQKIELMFVPHLTPMIRGIHATLYAVPYDRAADFQRLFSERYVDEPFIDILPPGSHPDTRSVKGVNTCRIAVHRPAYAKKVVVLSVIDNLVKGAAGQAVQNMNVMFDYDETLGLKHVGVSP